MQMTEKVMHCWSIPFACIVFNRTEQGKMTKITTNNQKSLKDDSQPGSLKP